MKDIMKWSMELNYVDVVEIIYNERRNVMESEVKLWND